MLDGVPVVRIRDLAALGGRGVDTRACFAIHVPRTIGN
jgi:hypothetical protein